MPGSVFVGARVSRGDFLGTVHQRTGVPPHLHMALVEIIGGAPSGQYQGVDLYQFFLALEASDPETVVPVQFWQDGSAPEPVWRLAQLGVLHRSQVPEPASSDATAASE